MLDRLLAVVALVVLLPNGAKADTISQNTAGTFYTGTTGFFGQSVTTSAGGPWRNIAFNFYDSSNNSYAVGTIYLLDRAYGGTPQALSASTAGYIGSAAASGGTSWIFDTSVTLQPLTQYWFYMGGTTPAPPGIRNDFDIYPGGGSYGSGRAVDNYSDVGADIDFTLSGTSPGPIPGAGPLSYLILALGGAAVFRRRLQTWTAAFFSC